MPVCPYTFISSYNIKVRIHFSEVEN